MTVTSLIFEGQPVEAEELTPQAFAKFGFVISADHQASAVIPGTTGLSSRYDDIAVFKNEYDRSPNNTVAPLTVNLQRFAPQKGLNLSHGTYHPANLERHPYTSQTFFPLGVDKYEPAFLVVVAENDKDNLPDLKTVKAFIARGGQSVTYNAAVWHGGTSALRDVLDMTMIMYHNGVKQDEVELIQLENTLPITFKL
ncbi:ureidoglycolate hydrolase [Lipomyces japonicus]|uniref:ureidoglycolate hydrolase n=1 Tax=Lipomyces japonicus TaxID=56871 RepID=UPI0034CE6D79